MNDPSVPPYYAPQEQLTGPARPRAELWRTAAGLMLGTVIFVALAQVFNGLQAAFVPAASEAGTVAMALSLLLGVGLIGVSAALVVITLHRRSPWTLIGNPDHAVRHFRQVSRPVAVVLLVTLLVFAVAGPARILPAQTLGNWLATLPLAVLAILVQASAEEIVFRGYFQQQLAARFSHPAIWMIGPSTLFAILHYSPDYYGENAIVIMFWAGLFGLAMSDLTARSGTLGAAIAAHVCMNLASIAGIALPDQTIALALYVLPFGADDVDAVRSLVPAEFLTLLVVWLAARLALRV